MSYRRSVLVFGFGLLTILLAACGGGGGGGAGGPSGNGPSSGPSDPFILHDAFGGTGIDGAKWLTGEYSAEIQGGTLVSTTSVVNARANTTYRDSLVATAAAPTSIQAVVNVTSTALTGDSGAAATLELRYQPAAFQDISFQNLLIARVEIEDTGTTLRVRKRIAVCNNADCTSGFVPADGVEVLASGLSLDTPYTLRVEFVPASNSFVVTFIDGATTLTSTTAASGFPTFSAADILNARLRTRVRGLAPSGGSGSITARYDDVTIDGLPYDDFTAASIDTSKWDHGEQSRTLTGGAVVVSQTQADSSRGNDLLFPEPSNTVGIKGLKADVTVNAYSVSGTDPYYRARLGGVFYNDGTLTVGAQPGSGVSDIYAEVAITDTQALYLVARCTELNCGTASVALSDDGAGNAQVPFNTVPLTLGSTHTLSIFWDGAQFAFQLDNETPVTFDPVAAGAPVAQAIANDPFKNIGTRANVGISGVGSGSLTATFDNFDIIGADFLETFDGPDLDGSLFDELDSSRIITFDSGGTNRVLELISRTKGPDGRMQLRFPTALAPTINAISADVTVLDSQQPPGFDTGARAVIKGAFYNNGSSDIGAEIVLTGSKAELNVFSCIDPDCNNVSFIFGPPLLIGVLIQGTTYTVTLTHDGSDGFTGTVGGVGTQTFNTGDVTFNPVISDAKSLESLVFITDSVSLMSATFDNVMIDTGAGLMLHDDFQDASGLIDSNKWRDTEALRAISGGQLTMDLRGTGNNTTVIAKRLQTIPGLVLSKHKVQAQLTVTQTDLVDDPADPGTGQLRAIVALMFAPGASSVPFDSTNAFFFRAGLRELGSGLEPYLAAFRCDDVPCVAFTDIPITQSGSQTFSLNVPYTASVEHDAANNQVLFVMGGVSGVANLAGFPQFDPADFFKVRVKVRVRDYGPNGSGLIRAIYDNLQVGQ